MVRLAWLIEKTSPMIPDIIIEKAIEGGWKPFGSFLHSNLIEKKWGVPEVWSNFYHQPTFILDPLFWKCLGKGLDWDNKKITIHIKLDARDDLSRVGRRLGNGRRSETVRFSRTAQSYSFQRKPRKDRWKKHSKDFFNLLMNGGNIEKFWKDLIKQ